MIRLQDADGKWRNTIEELSNEILNTLWGGPVKFETPCQQKQGVYLLGQARRIRLA